MTEEEEKELSQEVTEASNNLNALFVAILKKLADISTMWGLAGFLLGWGLTYLWVDDAFAFFQPVVKGIISILAVIIWIWFMPTRIMSKVSTIKINVLTKEEYEKLKNEEENKEGE